jgi:hypothetical protein
VQLWTPGDMSSEERGLVEKLGTLQTAPPASNGREKGFWARMKEALGA